MSTFGKAVVPALLVLFLVLGCGANEPTATLQPTIEAKLPSSATTVVPPTATVEIVPTPTAAPPSATPAPTATNVLPALEEEVDDWREAQPGGSEPELKGLVEVGDRRLYVHCVGQGAPTVVMEAGYNDTGETWSQVQPEVARFTRACVYDRLGLGRSDPGPEPSNSLQVVEELHTLLLNAGIQGPYVLVGHSLGGQYVRLYADRYEQDVVGLVLVDSSHPDQFRRSAAVLPPESPDDSESLKFYRDWFASVTPDPTLRPGLFEAGSLGDMPLVVLSVPNKERADDFPAELNAALNRIWVELQQELVQLSSNSSQVISEKSQHFIQRDEPELVIEAIRQVVSAAGGDAAPAPNVAVDLQGLSFDAFLEASYRQLQLRDPEMLVFNGLAEEYGLDNVCFTDLSPAYVRETQQLEAALLDLLRGYERDTLGPEQQKSYDVYEWYLDDRVRGHAFAYYDYPVNSLTIWGVQNWIVDYMASYLPVTDEQEAEGYIACLAQLDEWVAQVVEGLDLRAEAGVVAPRYILLASISQVEGHLGQQAGGSFDVEGMVLYNSFREKLAEADDIGAADKERLLAAAEAEIEKTFVPAFVTLRDYLRQLASEAPVDAGVWRLPEGEAYYAYLLRDQTGTEMSPDEVHELGLAEVARIQAEMQAAAAEMGYPAGISLAELNDRLWTEGGVLEGQALQAEYEHLIAQAQEASERFFGRQPAAELVIEAEPFGSGLAYYTPPPLDGSGPGKFYTNLNQTLPRFILPTVTYHETVPGHHFQGALAREAALPTFRRELIFNGQAEGWALYAEQLAWEMGLYEDDPLGNLGRLQFELTRAARLVVDTGIHAKGWTRNEAAAYYQEATGLQSSPAAMDRYVILPAQGCGYTIGLLKIRELRQRAMDRLGEAFDVKAFHDLILGQGAMPLAVLEQVVEDWIETGSAP